MPARRGTHPLALRLLAAHHRHPAGPVGPHPGEALSRPRPPALAAALEASIHLLESGTHRQQVSILGTLVEAHRKAGEFREAILAFERLEALCPTPEVDTFDSDRPHSDYARAYWNFEEAAGAYRAEGQGRRALSCDLRWVCAELGYHDLHFGFDRGCVARKLRAIAETAADLGLAAPGSCRPQIQDWLRSYGDRQALLADLGEAALAWGLPGDARHCAWVGLNGHEARPLGPEEEGAETRCHELLWRTAGLDPRSGTAASVVRPALRALQHLRCDRFHDWPPRRQARHMALERLWVSRLLLAPQAEPEEAYRAWSWVKGSSDALRRRVFQHLRQDGTEAQRALLEAYLASIAELRQGAFAQTEGDSGNGALEEKRDQAWAQLQDSVKGTLEGRILTESDPPAPPRLRFGQVLVDFVRLEEDPALAEDSCQERAGHYLAFVLKPGSIQLLRIGPAAPIENAIGRMIQGVEAPATLDRGVFAELYDLLFRSEGDLESHVRGRRELTLIPDGLLFRIPWDALEMPVPDGRGGTTRSPLVAQDLLLRLAGSIRELRREGSRPVGPGDRIAWILADPDFEGEDPGTPSGLRGHASRSLRGLPAFTRLEHTGKEAAAVAEACLRAGMTPCVRVRGDASEEALAQVRRPALLHVATHGFFVPWEAGAAPEDLDALSRCGIALAGANASRQQGRRRGLVTADRVLDLDLEGSLVMLSACETGLGSVVAGEDLQGFRTALRLAGARTVGGALWKIPDALTRGLMTQFYRHLAEGRPPLEALRDAKRLRLRSLMTTERRAYHQVLWAGLQLYG